MRNLVQGLPEVVWKTTRQLTEHALALRNDKDAGFVKFVYLHKMMKPFCPLIEWHLDVDPFRDTGQSVERKLRAETRDLIPTDAIFELGFAGSKLLPQMNLLHSLVSYGDKVYFSFSYEDTAESAAPTKWLNYYDKLWKLVEADSNVYLDICHEFCERVAMTGHTEWTAHDWKTITLLRNLPALFCASHGERRAADAVNMLLKALEGAYRSKHFAVIYHCANVLEWIGYAYPAALTQRSLPLMERFCELHLDVAENAEMPLGCRIEALWSISWLNQASEAASIYTATRLNNLELHANTASQHTPNEKFRYMIATAQVRRIHRDLHQAGHTGLPGTFEALVTDAVANPEMAAFHRQQARNSLRQVVELTSSQSSAKIVILPQALYLEATNDGTLLADTIENHSLNLEFARELQADLQTGLRDESGSDSVLRNLSNTVFERVLSSIPATFLGRKRLMFSHTLAWLPIPLELLRLLPSFAQTEIVRAVNGVGTFASPISPEQWTEQYYQQKQVLKCLILASSTEPIKQYANTIATQIHDNALQSVISVAVDYQTIDTDEDIEKVHQSYKSANTKPNIIYLASEVVIPRDNPHHTQLVFGTAPIFLSMSKLRTVLADLTPELVFTATFQSGPPPKIDPSMETVWNGVTTAVLEAGVPSSITNRWHIAYKDFAIFSDLFFQTLMTVGDIPAAVRDACTGLTDSAKPCLVLIHNGSLR